MASTVVVDTKGVVCRVDNSSDDVTYLNITTKSHVHLTDVALVGQVLRDFMQHLRPRSGVLYIDCSSTELFTMQQLMSISTELHQMRTAFRERLVGTIVRVSRSLYLNQILARFFERVYKPVRPYKFTTADASPDAIGALVEEMRKQP